ncbi:MAG: hypothetical protein J6X49_17325 [Victivallales bacterium]|nr:hypothetical protein [Victivallales bacterium]
MKIIRLTMSLAVSCLLLASCSIFKHNSMLEDEMAIRNASELERLQKEANQRQLREEILKAFEYIRTLVSEHRFVEAENYLGQLRQFTEYKTELDDLQQLIDLARKLTLSKTDLAIDQKTIINESLTGLQLPKNYNKTREIPQEETKDEQNFLEKLMDKTISMKVTNMSLAEFAMQLRDLEGLNMADPVNVIFNDEALKGKTFSANFKDVPLREIFDYLSYTLAVDFNIRENIIWITKLAKPAEGPQLMMKIIPLRQGVIPNVPEGIGVAAAAKAAFETAKEADTDLDTALKAFFEKSKTGGSYHLFPQRNVLLVRDTLANIREVEKIVATFSKPPKQVLIEARFLTVSESDLHDVGVELTHYNGGKIGKTIPAKNQENANISDFFTKLGILTAENAEGVGAMTVSGIIGNRSFDVLISALEKKASTVTLSAPRITALNNRTARIRKGDKMVYFEEYGLQTVDNGDKGKDQVLVPSGKPTPLALGITFDVLPSIGTDNKTILLGLKPEIVTFVQWEDYAATKTVTENKVNKTVDTNVLLPRTHEQTLATAVSINSGETVILGGMVENRETKEVHKVPFLGDIPLIGALFTHTSNTSEPTNLLIFVTATIIDENGEYVVAKP